MDAREDSSIATGDAGECRRKLNAGDGGEAEFRRDKQGAALAAAEVEEVAMLRVRYCGECFADEAGLGRAIDCCAGVHGLAGPQQEAGQHAARAHSMAAVVGVFAVPALVRWFVLVIDDEGLAQRRDLRRTPNHLSHNFLETQPGCFSAWLDRWEYLVDGTPHQDDIDGLLLSLVALGRNTKQPSIKGSAEIELVPDAWPRFEKFIHEIAKAGPQHRASAAKPKPRAKATKRAAK
jgi:hypothetical protein